MNNKFHAGIKYGIGFIIIVLFCYFRLKPVLLQTVGYTFDQGRDFLKAAEIVLTRNPTFIGPTTGIGGIFHGAWWYYILSFIFVVSGGSPVSFYVWNVLIQGLGTYMFYRFLHSQFGFLTAAILTTLIATSGYFIFTSIFIGNNVFAIPSVILLSISTLFFLQNRNSVYISWLRLHLPIALLMGLGLGFIAEFEFAFGLMILPTYMVVMGAIVLGDYLSQRLSIHRLKYSLLLFCGGVAFPFLPRILFELKNNFPQTKVLLNFILHPAYHTPKPYSAVLHDRLILFQGYFYGLFITDYVRIVCTIAIAAMLISMIVRRKVRVSRSLIFVLSMLVGLFLASTGYRDTFWAYYYDGIQIFILLLIGFLLPKPAHTWLVLQYMKVCLLLFLLTIGLIHMKADLSSAKVYDGLRVQRDIVGYIHALETPNKTYCVQIYTPPVIPYTYQYLFLYAHYAHSVAIPHDTWTKKQCWIILEHDDNKERKEKWITDHIPQSAKRLSHKKFKDVDVELWKLKK